MTLHVGERVLYRGEPHLVKEAFEHAVTIEDEYGFAFGVPIDKVQLRQPAPTDLDETVRYSTIPDCGICDRRPQDFTVVIDGEETPICTTCFERMEVKS